MRIQRNELQSSCRKLYSEVLLYNNCTWHVLFSIFICWNMNFISFSRKLHKTSFRLAWASDSNWEICAKKILYPVCEAPCQHSPVLSKKEAVCFWPLQKISAKKGKRLSLEDTMVLICTNMIFVTDPEFVVVENG